MSQHSSLSSSSYYAIIPDYEDKWPMLNGAHQHSELHLQFWGKPIEDYQSEVKSMDIDVDEETGEDEDDELGCHYILNVGIEGIRCQIYVRKEFIQFYNLCDNYLAKDREDLKPHSVVILGQPGIGKTCWRYYALCRCLSEKKPVIWYDDGQLILFVEEGVYTVPPNFSSTDFKSRVWTLVNANNNMDQILPHLIQHDTQHLLIFTVSPKSSPWKPLSKCTLPTVFIMNPWTKSEIFQVSIIHGLANQQQAICDAYDQYGPTPRICLDYLRDEGVGLISHEEHFQAALTNLSLDPLEKIMTALTKYEGTNNLSPLIFLLRRRQMTEVMVPQTDSNNVVKYILGTVQPITHVVEEELQNHFKRLSLMNKCVWFNRFSGIPTGRVLACLMYETIVHETFSENIMLHLFPMKMDKQNNSWTSSHGDVSVQPSPIKTQPTRTIIYGNSSNSDLETGLIQPQVHYILKKKSQAGFNSFIMTDNILYLFQVTIVLKQEIKPGLLDFFEKVSEESLPRDLPWKFIFVVPTHHTQISCPQPKDCGLVEKLQGRMELFSAVLYPDSVLD